MTEIAEIITNIAKAIIFITVYLTCVITVPNLIKRINRLEKMLGVKKSDVVRRENGAVIKEYNIEDYSE